MKVVERLRQSLDEIRQQNRDIRALVELDKFGLGYLPWTSSALAPSALELIVNDILINRRRTVVELGAGISTLLLGACLKSCGGFITSFEHDEDWAAIVAGLVKDNGLSEVAQVVHAPLRDTGSGEDALPWYDMRILSDRLGERKVELLLVDGPPAYQKGHGRARQPALPFFVPYLDEPCAVYLDDVDRDGERAVLEAWKRNSDFSFSTPRHRGNVARGVRGASFNVQ